MYKANSSQTAIDKEVNKIVKEILEKRNDNDFYHEGVFNTKDLPDHKGYTYSPNMDLNFGNGIFKKLNTIRKNHCLYWFELENNSKANELNSLIDEYREKKKEIGYKKVPAKNNNKISNVLYLGKRQGGCRKDGLTNIEGRVNQHLGYYEVPTTQGLQLYEYARDKGFEITLKVIEFEGLEPYLLNVIEKLLAKRMNPLCGQHR